MFLDDRTLWVLVEIINEKSQYRKGPELVRFFNQLGFNDTYSWGGGFPSRKDYTFDKLKNINGKPELDKCIKLVFAPRNFVGRYSDLDTLISELNSQMSYDGWKVIRNNNEISFKKVENVNIDEEILKENKDSNSSEISIEDFLSKEYTIDISLIKLNPDLQDVLQQRISEITLAIKNKLPLSAIFMIGSSLEGIFLHLATSYPQKYNTAHSAPKDKVQKVRPFTEWTLNNYIDVSKEIGIIREDVSKFSKGVRDFRNYIHPYEQMINRFNPDINTAKICFQVLKAAINQIESYLAKQ